MLAAYRYLHVWSLSRHFYGSRKTLDLLLLLQMRGFKALYEQSSNQINQVHVQLNRDYDVK